MTQCEWTTYIGPNPGPCSRDATKRLKLGSATSTVLGYCDDHAADMVLAGACVVSEYVKLVCVADRAEGLTPEQLRTLRAAIDERLEVAATHKLVCLHAAACAAAAAFESALHAYESAGGQCSVEINDGPAVFTFGAWVMLRLQLQSDVLL